MKILKTKSVIALFATAFLVAGFVMSNMASATVPGVNELLNVDSSGNQGNGASYSTTISGDGRYVAFQSAATNLVSGDMNGVPDIFVRDRTNDTTARVSVSTAGVEANAGSNVPSISYDGRYVLFFSSATNLGTTTAGAWYVHDMQSGTINVASSTSEGTVANRSSNKGVISGDGRFVVFDSTASNLVSGVGGTHLNVYRKDMKTGNIKLLSATSGGSEGNNGSLMPSISCDGGIVVFMTAATDLVSGMGNHSIVVDNISAGNELSTIANSPDNSSEDTPVISCNGNYIAYQSDATNLVSGDTNSASDVFEYNRLTEETTRISMATSGTQGDNSSWMPSISDDGRYVAFQSNATTLTSQLGSGTNIYVHDLKGGTTQLISIDRNGNKTTNSQVPVISMDGSYVSYQSTSQTLLSSGTVSYNGTYISESGF